MKEILDNVIFFLWPTINPDGQDIVVKATAARRCSAARRRRWSSTRSTWATTTTATVHAQRHRLARRAARVARVGARHHLRAPPVVAVPDAHLDSAVRRSRSASARRRSRRARSTRSARSSRRSSTRTGSRARCTCSTTYDAWYPGYIDYMPMYQNIPSWWTETQGGNCATPRTTHASPISRATTGARARRRSTRARGLEGKWRLRDAVNYMVTADIATLDYAAKFKRSCSTIAIRRRATRSSSTGRADRTRTSFRRSSTIRVAPVELLRRMAFMGIRVSSSTATSTTTARRYPKGTWVIPMDQEFAQLVRELFEPQNYPDMGDDTPYDAAGWTLPFQMGVNVVEGKTPLSADVRAALKPVRRARPSTGTPTPTRAVHDERRSGGHRPARRARFTGTGDQLCCSIPRRTTRSA